MSNEQKHLGLRCSNTDFAFAVLSGSKEHPQLEHKQLVRFPKNLSRAQSLKWFYQELHDLLKRHTVNSITIKGTELIARKGDPYEARVENEAIAFLVAAEHNLGAVVARKVNATMARDILGAGKGKASLLATEADTSFVPNFPAEDAKIQEAIYAAWSAF